MIDTGCPHPESEVVTIEAELTLVHWCALCGSIRDNNGDHGAPAGTWRAWLDVLVVWRDERILEGTLVGVSRVRRISWDTSVDRR